jgi:hypothetical protein
MNAAAIKLFEHRILPESQAESRKHGDCYEGRNEFRHENNAPADDSKLGDATAVATVDNSIDRWSGHFRRQRASTPLTGIYVSCHLRRPQAIQACQIAHITKHCTGSAGYSTIIASIASLPGGLLPTPRAYSHAHYVVSDVFLGLFDGRPPGWGHFGDSGQTGRSIRGGVEGSGNSTGSRGG